MEEVIPIKYGVRRCLGKFHRVEGEGGFSLVEILLATTVFLLIAVSVVSLLVSGYRFVAQAERRNGVIFEARRKMENAMSDPGYSDEGVTRQEDKQLTVFGRTVGGSVVIVEEVYDDERDLRIRLQAFAPDQATP